MITVNQRRRPDKPTVLEHNVLQALGDPGCQCERELMAIHARRVKETLGTFYWLLRKQGIAPRNPIVVGALDALANLQRIEGRIAERQHMYALAIAYDCIEESP